MFDNNRRKEREIEDEKKEKKFGLVYLTAYQLKLK